MKSPSTKVIATAAALVLIGLCAFLVYKIGLSHRRSFQSIGFYGPDFHSPTEADRDAIFRDVCDHLKRLGFHDSTSPNADGSSAGIHSQDDVARWFERTDPHKSVTWVSISESTTAVSAYIKWQNRGTQEENREAYRRALKLALDVDEWFGTVSVPNSLPKELIAKKTAWFESELSKISGS